MLVRLGQATHLLKYGDDLKVYELGTNAVKLAHVSVVEGHFQEFYHRKSRFVYYVIDGAGTFFLNGEPHQVKAGDTLSIPPDTRIYYVGAMEMILVTTPAWTPDGEVLVRTVPRSEAVPQPEVNSRDWTLDDNADDQRAAGDSD